MPSEIVYVYEGHEHTGERSTLEGTAGNEPIRTLEREERAEGSAGTAEARECGGVLRSAA